MKNASRFATTMRRLGLGSICAFACIGSALAGSPYGTSAWYSVKLTSVTAQHGDGSGVLIQLAIVGSLPANPAGCPVLNSYAIRDTLLNGTATGIALAALAAGATVNVYVSNSCDAPSGEPLLLGVSMLAPT
jgi:hypothetical protein